VGARFIAYDVRRPGAHGGTPLQIRMKRDQSPINGALETNCALIPRRKRLGYAKVKLIFC